MVLVSGGRNRRWLTGESRAFQLCSGQLRHITEDYTIGNLVGTSACSRQRSPST
jgi:hypothetical protein